MKISIITVCFNNEKTIEHTIRSVLAQKYKNIEYLIIDGNSTDNTLSIINKYNSDIDFVISENDKGIYDAINKGIKHSSGDVVGFLHADDFFKNSNVIYKVISSFSEGVDMVYGDIDFVSIDDSSKIKRKWKSKSYVSGSFKWGWMPPHTSFFLLKENYVKYGDYSLNLGTSADYELMLRMFEVHKLTSKHIPLVVTCMRLGGASNKSFKNRWRANRNDKRSWKNNNINPYWVTFLLKPLRKISQFF